MPQQIYNLDWLSTNETIKYPIDSKASFVPVGCNYVPTELMGVITDISMAIPASYTKAPYLAALSITDDLLTLVICINTEPVFAFSSTQRSLYTNRYYDLTSFVSGCSGVIVFGSSAKTLRCNYKFDSAADSGFLPSTYYRYQNFPVTSIGLTGNRAKCIGDVQFKGAGDIKVDVESLDALSGSQKVLTIGLDYSLGEDTIYKYNGPCDVRPESDTCSRTSVQRLGVVTPDEDGNINIVGEGITVDSSRDYGGQIILSTDYVMSDVCAQPRTLVAEDQCLTVEPCNYVEGNTCFIAKKTLSKRFNDEIQVLSYIYVTTKDKKWSVDCEIEQTELNEESIELAARFYFTEAEIKQVDLKYTKGLGIFDLKADTVEACPTPSAPEPSKPNSGTPETCSQKLKHPFTRINFNSDIFPAGDSGIAISRYGVSAVEEGEVALVSVPKLSTKALFMVNFSRPVDDGFIQISFNLVDSHIETSRYSITINADGTVEDNISGILIKEIFFDHKDNKKQASVSVNICGGTVILSGYKNSSKIKKVIRGNLENFGVVIAVKNCYLDYISYK